MNTQSLPERFCYPSPAFGPFWTSPLGRVLLGFIGKPSDEEVYQHGTQLMVGDSKADAVADLLQHMPMNELRAMIAQALDHGIETVDNAPQALVDLFAEIDHMPDWVDADRLQLASEVIRRSGRFGGYALRNFALMGGYQSSAINKPLVFTGALDVSSANRIAETNAFWLDISRENGLQRFAPGVKTAIRVRIMHAMLRVRIQRNPEWSNDKWGLPINQSDMLVTNLAFSTLFTEGSRLMGVHITRKEAEAVLHFWKYVGYLLGINVESMPTTEKAARKLLYILTIAQPSADEDSKHLARALMEEPMQAAIPKQAWQRRLRCKFHHGLSRYFLDNHACKNLGIPHTPWVLAGPMIAAPVFALETARRIIPGATRYAVKRGDRVQTQHQQGLMDGKLAQYQPVAKLRNE